MGESPARLSDRGCCGSREGARQRSRDPLTTWLLRLQAGLPVNSGLKLLDFFPWGRAVLKSAPSAVLAVIIAVLTVRKTTRGQSSLRNSTRCVC